MEIIFDGKYWLVCDGDVVYASFMSKDSAYRYLNVLRRAIK